MLGGFAMLRGLPAATSFTNLARRWYGLSEPNGVTLAPALLARTDEVTEGKERLAGLARSKPPLAVRSVRFSACIFISTAPKRH